MQASPGPPESLAGLATAPGFSSPTPPARRTRLQAEQAGIAQGAVRRGGCRRGFPCRAAIGAAQGLLQLAGTAGQRRCGEALPLMVCRVAALPDIALAELAFELGEEGPACPERSAATPGRSAPGCRRNARRYRPAPRPVRPRPLPLPARPRAPLCRDDRAGKAPGALSIGFATWSFMPAAGQASRSASEALAVMADRQPGEAPVGADSPGRLETIDIRHLHVHQHRVERHARLQHLLNARQPAVGEGHPGALAAQQLGGDWRFSALSSTTSRRTPATAGCAPPGAAAGWPGRPVRRATHAAPSRPVAWA